MPALFALLSPTLVLSTAGIAVALIALVAYLSRPKRYYLVRHGQTLMNMQGLKQGAEGGLSPKGISQAEALGKALASVRIDHIYTSPYERAIETATIIARFSPAPIISVPLLIERRSPSAVVGKPADDPGVMHITGLTEYGYHEDSFRFADEENFEDLRTRAAACLRYLASKPGRTNVAVTHHVFLQMLTAYLLYREKISASEYVKLAFFNPIENAGITTYTYVPLKRFSKTRGWSVDGYNEMA